MEKGAALASILAKNNAAKRKSKKTGNPDVPNSSSVDKLPKLERKRSVDQYQQMAEMVAQQRQTHRQTPIN